MIFIAFLTKCFQTTTTEVFVCPLPGDQSALDNRDGMVQSSYVIFLQYSNTFLILCLERRSFFSTIKEFENILNLNFIAVFCANGFVGTSKGRQQCNLQVSSA
jgi:hypothetical protein